MFFPHFNWKHSDWPICSPVAASPFQACWLVGHRSHLFSTTDLSGQWIGVPWLIMIRCSQGNPYQPSTRKWLPKPRCILCSNSKDPMFWWPLCVLILGYLNSYWWQGNSTGWGKLGIPWTIPHPQGYIVSNGPWDWSEQHTMTYP